MHKVLNCCFFCLDAMFVTFLTILVGTSFLIFWFLVMCPLSQHIEQTDYWKVLNKVSMSGQLESLCVGTAWPPPSLAFVLSVVHYLHLSSSVFGKLKWLHFQSCFLSLLSVELFVLHIDSPVKSVGQSLHENIVRLCELKRFLSSSRVTFQSMLPLTLLCSWFSICCEVEPHLYLNQWLWPSFVLPRKTRITFTLYTQERGKAVSRTCLSYNQYRPQLPFLLYLQALSAQFMVI